MLIRERCKAGSLAAFNHHKFPIAPSDEHLNRKDTLTKFPQCNFEPIFPEILRQDLIIDLVIMVIQKYM